MTSPAHPDDADGWADVQRLDSELARRLTDLAAAAWDGPLPPVTRALILFAGAVTCSGVDRAEAERHVRLAISLGATSAQLAEVVELTCVLGVHTATMATPILLEELEAAGHVAPEATPASELVRSEFELRRGYWSPMWDAVANLAPRFLSAYLDFSSLPSERQALDARTRELVLVAVNAITTHLFADGTRVHIRNSLALGLNADEVMHVLRLLSGVSARSALVGFDVLASLESQSTTTHESRS
ncbi:carboxymuconolactone decarboxylase family protein [Nocardioides sp.]|uniref:carboxymuconolactone decarboxylase family protein n=1 Tax=Nocardioides sp. TaxID=35761 RepID=UPI003D1254EF